MIQSPLSPGPSPARGEGRQKRPALSGGWSLGVQAKVVCSDSPSPLVGEGLGRGGMDTHRFARELRQNMTDAEQLLWRHLRAHRLAGDKFRRQQPIGRYVVDFVHFGARVIVEADGGQHNNSAHDRQRDGWLTGQGFTVLRFWNHEILSNTEGVLAAIHAAVTAPSPPAPLP